MLDARQEASIAMENVKETASGMLKTVGAIGKMANSAYLKLLAMRRKQYTDAGLRRWLKAQTIHCLFLRRSD